MIKWYMRDENAPCRSAREFGDIFRAEIKQNGRGWDWRKDIRPWMASALNGVKFGDPDYDWTPSGAVCLAREFLSEASTW